MKIRLRLAFTAAAGVLILNGTARAEYTGLSTESYQATFNNNVRTLWRVYANFTSPTDGIVSWGAIGTDLTIQNILADQSLSTTGFYNQFGANGNLPPYQSLPPDDFSHHPELDSYYTINLKWMDENPDPAFYQIWLSGMPNIATGAVTLQAGEGSASVNVTPTAPFALAGWHNADPPRVMLAQFQVGNGQHVRGTLGFLTLDSQVIVGTFNSAIPGPGVLALLTSAFLLNRRRRK